jgi:CRP/FNR family cyclic AMP-dependent transcriptional regulator
MRGSDIQTRAEQLERIPLFEGMSLEHLHELASVSRVHSCKRKQELFHKGDQGSDVYVVLTGRLKALTTSADGNDVVFTILGPGDVVGEIAMLADLPRTATVVAKGDVEVLVFPGPELVTVLRKHPTASKLLDHITHRRVQEKKEKTFAED